MEYCGRCGFFGDEEAQKSHVCNPNKCDFCGNEIGYNPVYPESCFQCGLSVIEVANATSFLRKNRGKEKLVVEQLREESRGTMVEGFSFEEALQSWLHKIRKGE